MAIRLSITSVLEQRFLFMGAFRYGWPIPIHAQHIQKNLEYSFEDSELAEAFVYQKRQWPDWHCKQTDLKVSAVVKALFLRFSSVLAANIFVQRMIEKFGKWAKVSRLSDIENGVMIVVKERSKSIVEISQFFIDHYGDDYARLFLII